MKKLLLLVLTLIFTFPALAEPPADDGLLRVWLKSLGDPQALRLTLRGDYALEHSGTYRLESGSELTLAAQGSEVWLHIGGLSLNLGQSATLARQTPGGGVTIGGSALYCGDLSVSATRNGLRPILTLPVEEYLPGVVACEMSDSFPLEALKAQAVAARTYALRRKAAAGERAYDLTDTPADQVYRGTNPEFENVAEAVRATAGQVCLCRGAYAACYFTASNGGQTALPSQLWGDARDDACFAVADDPYDLENPRSLENDLTFTDTCQGSVKLRKLLTAALDAPMKGQGYGDWRLDRIVDIRPAAPRFPGSRLYDRLTFDLRVMVPESALYGPAPSAAPDPDLPPVPERWVPLPRAQRVSLDVFTDIKDGLSMGLNRADCELISVEHTGDTFRLVMRRYGHGVGMSQRGAQQMAGAHGMDYMQILKFYYPGVTVTGGGD